MTRADLAPSDNEVTVIMEHGIYLHEGMTFEGLIEREVYEFAYVFAPLKIVGATGSPGNPIALL